LAKATSIRKPGSQRTKDSSPGPAGFVCYAPSCGNDVVNGLFKRAEVTYEELAAKLREMGFEETRVSVANKLSRGTFSATFLIAVMRAVGREHQNLADV
jgi:hypothetical protein